VLPTLLQPTVPKTVLGLAKPGAAYVAAHPPTIKVYNEDLFSTYLLWHFYKTVPLPYFDFGERVICASLDCCLDFVESIFDMGFQNFDYRLSTGGFGIDRDGVEFQDLDDEFVH